jgi:hypothetical protein
MYERGAGHVEILQAIAVPFVLFTLLRLSKPDETILFARRHAHSMHPPVLGALRCFPSLQDLLIRELIYLHSERTASSSHTALLGIPTPIRQIACNKHD